MMFALKLSMHDIGRKLKSWLYHLAYSLNKWAFRIIIEVRIIKGALLVRDRMRMRILVKYIPIITTLLVKRLFNHGELFNILT